MNKFVIVLLVSLCLVTFTAEAQMYQCKGYNDSGESIPVVIDFITDVLNTNGNIYKIVSEGASFANTENFPISNNLIVYYSFKIINNHFYLIQYNTYTNAPLSTVSLTCLK